VAPIAATYAGRVGTLYYGDSGTPIGIEDRALAHLKIAITTKLRRGESFTLSWQHAADQARGRSTLWLHPSIPLRFVFDEPEAPDLSRQWIEDLMRSANSTGGIQLVPEQLDTEPIPTEADQPVHVGADVQEVDAASKSGGPRSGGSKPAASESAPSTPATKSKKASKPA
jgi:hypothetical protein